MSKTVDFFKPSAEALARWETDGGAVDKRNDGERAIAATEATKLRPSRRSGQRGATGARSTISKK